MKHFDCDFKKVRLIIFCFAYVVQSAASQVTLPTDEGNFGELLKEFANLERPRLKSLEIAGRTFKLMENDNTEKCLSSLRKTHDNLVEFRKFFQDMYNSIQIVHSPPTKKQGEKALMHIKEYKKTRREPWNIPVNIKVLLEEVGPEFYKELAPVFDAFIASLRTFKQLYKAFRNTIDNFDVER